MKTHEMSGTSIYKSWTGMKYRCYNKNSPDYHRYGGRGIRICDRWLKSFEDFYKDMGDKPNETTLDRKNNEGNYEPVNCKWSTKKEQANNRRRFNVTGVSFKPNGGTWEACLTFNKIYHYIGRYPTKNDAIIARTMYEWDLII